MRGELWFSGFEQMVRHTGGQIHDIRDHANDIGLDKSGFDAWYSVPSVFKEWNDVQAIKGRYYEETSRLVYPLLIPAIAQLPILLLQDNQRQTWCYTSHYVRGFSTQD
jgi:hypothetical protein